MEARAGVGRLLQIGDGEMRTTSLPAAAVSRPPGTRVFVVAVSQAEADDLADLIGHATRKEAEAHLSRVQAPPTDSFYASQYRVYESRLPGAEQAK